MRTVERLEGLALAGRASVGALSLEVPCLLTTLPPGESDAGAFVTSGTAPSGVRRLVLGLGEARLPLEVPIPAPEIAPTGSGVVDLGDGAALLHAPCTPEGLRELRALRPALLVLGNARALWNDGEPFVRAVRAIRGELGAEPLLWTPRLALPHRLPILVYLGVDLLDTTDGELRSAGGEFLDPALGPRPLPTNDADRGCDCPACASTPAGPLREHAAVAYRRAWLEARAALRRGSLRELVEARLAAEPASAEMLRYADAELADLLESRTPVTGDRPHAFVHAESLRRPEMRRFRERLLERYRPPASKSVLLLVPCSRTKPYRRSPSHRRFAGALDGLPAAERVQVVSISSPIGVVPRELEDVPPARHYDVPVTGSWTAEERAIVERGLRHLLRNGSYRHVIVHLDPEEYRFVHDIVDGAGPEVVGTCVDDRPTAAAAIARLHEGLATALQGEPAVPGGPLSVVAEELRELASVQFGRLAGERLFARPVRLAGRPWFQRVTDGRNDLATVREERGLFHLTVAGALRLGETVPRVDVEPGLSLEGDLFAPGVLGADPAIRAGDSVGLFRNGVLAAVGEAALPGPLLGDLRRGLAVRVRHRHHAGPDTAKTPPTPAPTGR